MTSPEHTLRFILAGHPYDIAYGRQIPRKGDNVVLHEELFHVEAVTWIYSDNRNNLESTVVDLVIVPIKTTSGPLRYE